MDLANQMGVKLRDFMPAFFIAIAGSTASTPVMQTMVTIGPDLTLPVCATRWKLSVA